MRLAGDDVAAQGRVSFSTQGMGFACLVGRARVFCTHGNEVDAWNMVDYDALRELAISQNAVGCLIARVGCPTRAPSCQGCHDQRQTQYADRPPQSGDPGCPWTLVVIDPSQAKIEKITSSLAAYLKQLKGTLKLWGWLSVEEPPVSAVDQPVPQLLGPNLLAAVQGPGSSSATDPTEMLRQAERAFVEPRRRQTVASGTPETLGLPGMVWDRLRGVDPAEALRQALKDWLSKDRSFDITERDQTFRDVTTRVGAAVDFVVTGHTHLERALRIQDGIDRFYYNCGTWIRLLRFTDFVLEAPRSFASLPSSCRRPDGDD